MSTAEATGVRVPASRERLALLSPKVKTGLGKSDRPGLQGGSRKHDQGYWCVRPDSIPTVKRQGGAHILNSHDRSFLDVELDKPESAEQSDCVEEEREANEFAKNQLLSREAYKSFVQSTRPFFARSKVLTFAEQMKRHPSIVVGRLQYEREIPAQNLNGLHVKIKQHLVGQIDC